MSDDWPRPQSSEMIHSVHQSCGDVIRLFLSRLPSHDTVWIFGGCYQRVKTVNVFIECSGSVDMPTENSVILITWVMMI